MAPAEVAITISAVGDAPNNFTIEYYDGSTWQIAKTITSLIWPVANMIMLFPIGTTFTAAQSDLWRIKETLKQNGASFSVWAELEFKANSVGSDLSDSTKAFATASGGSNPPSLAFDNNTGTKWSNGTTLPQRAIRSAVKLPRHR